MPLVWFFFWLLQPAPNPVPTPPPALNRKQSTSLLRSAEQHMADTRKTYRPVRKLVIDEHTGEQRPFVDVRADLSNPLVDQACTLRLRFENSLAFQQDDLGQREGTRELLLTSREALMKEIQFSYVLECSVVARLEGLFDLAHVDPAAADSAFLAGHRARRLRQEISELERRARLRSDRDEPIVEPVSISPSGKEPDTTTEAADKRSRKTGGGGGGGGGSLRRASPRRYALQLAPTRLRPGYPIRWYRGGVHGGAGSSRRTPSTRETPEETMDSSDVAELSTGRRLRRAQEEHASAERHIDVVSREFRDLLERARHTVLVAMPAGWSPPEKLPTNFNAQLWIHAVEWDRAATLPTLILHSSLLNSSDLNVSGTVQP